PTAHPRSTISAPSSASPDVIVTVTTDGSRPRCHPRLRYSLPPISRQSTPTSSSTSSSSTWDTSVTGCPGSASHRAGVPGSWTIHVPREIGTPAASRTAAEAASSSDDSSALSACVIPRSARSPMVASGSTVHLHQKLRVQPAAVAAQIGRQHPLGETLLGLGDPLPGRVLHCGRVILGPVGMPPDPVLVHVVLQQAPAGTGQITLPGQPVRENHRQAERPRLVDGRPAVGEHHVSAHVLGEGGLR